MFTYFNRFKKPTKCWFCHSTAKIEDGKKYCSKCEVALQSPKDDLSFTLCPMCGGLPANLICQDGGSNVCSRCDALYHRCIDGTVTHGSPGPLLCKNCHPEMKLDS